MVFLFLQTQSSYLVITPCSIINQDYLQFSCDYFLPTLSSYDELIYLVMFRI